MSGKTELIHIDPDMSYWQVGPLLAVRVSKAVLADLMEGRAVEHLEEGKDYIFEGEEDE